MTLRTPRRRISPQTRRRCRAIKGFFKRALGSLSQPDLLQITSSIAVNVTDINHKIVGIEQQLHQVCKTCRDNIRDISSVRSKSSTLEETRNTISQQEVPSTTTFKGKYTKILYTKPQNQYKSSDQSYYGAGTNNESNRAKSDNTMNIVFSDERVQKLKKKKSKTYNKGNDYDVESRSQNLRTESSHKNLVSTYSTTSFHSLDQVRNYTTPTFPNDTKEKRRRPKGLNSHHINKTHRKPDPAEYEIKAETSIKNKKPRHHGKELDSDFIADIIRRQYKPIKFGRRNSDLSQFSAPVCRDRERYLTADCYNIPEVHHFQPSDFNGIQSVCDAPLYKAKKNYRTKHRKQADIYNNSDIYDLVPVKEKSSPKSRRKFIEGNMQSNCYKEVPPSPRTHRPRLNLKARYAESDCNVEALNFGKMNSHKHTTRHREIENNYQRSVNRKDMVSPRNIIRHHSNQEFEKNYDPNEIQIMKRNNLNQADKERSNSVISGIYPVLPAEEHLAPVETPLNKTQETLSSDKTDKALCEIKDILQSFLMEIKKESSHNEKSNDSGNMTERGSSPINNANTMTSNRQSFSNFNSAQCPVPPSPFMPTLPGFANTCCYPLMPIYPVNCMQNSYPVPSASIIQNNSVDKSNEICNGNHNTKINANDSCETDELIKEIYKFVSQSPTFCRKGNGSKSQSDSKQAFRNRDKLITSRSVGGSTRVCGYDAKVGTTKTYCVSKSCDAIKLSSDTCSSDTNASYSDTVLDKLSLEATQSSSEPESSTEVTEVNKVKRSKFARVLKSLGLNKKMKKDVIEELSESETTTVEDEKKSPYRQNVAQYAMHGQEYYSPPPVSPNYRPQYPQNYRPPYNPDIPYWDPRLQTRTHSPSHPNYRPEEYPSAPPYPYPFESYQTQPQVPLCLQEVEVKSIGCQSENKLSFFRKITKKIQQPVISARGDNVQKNGSTQTTQNKPGLFSWKNPQLGMNQVNPHMFGYKTQKKLVERDMKMRNAMLKKMFYKRNPFSPRNLIVRTLLGKDKSSFGDPPAAFRQRIFM